MLILFPDNPEEKYREVLVLIRPVELKEKWDGRRLRANEATELSSIKTIVWLDSLDALLQKWVHASDNIYLSTNEHDRKSTNYAATRDYRFVQEMKERYPLHNYERTAKIMLKQRAVKTKYEVEVIQQAIDITDKTFRRLLKFIKPGVMEYEIEAELVHEFLRNRAKGEAYSSIIASGDRARTLHYVFNNEEAKDGELILMDFGANYGCYAADLTRTVPVNGKFQTDKKKFKTPVCICTTKQKVYLSPEIP